MIVKKHDCQCSRSEILQNPTTTIEKLLLQSRTQSLQATCPKPSDLQTLNDSYTPSWTQDKYHTQPALVKSEPSKWKWFNQDFRPAFSRAWEHADRGTHNEW